MTPRRLARLLAGLGSVVLAAVLVVTVWVVRERAGAQFLKQAAGVVPGSLLSARNFHWTQMKSGRKQWELAASQASFYDDKKKLRLRDADLSMISDDGKHLMLHAPLADLTLQGNHVSRADLSGGLKVRYGDVLVIGRKATFSPDGDELTVPGPVTIETGGLKVTGNGLTAHPRAQLFELHEQVVTEVMPRGSAGVQRSAAESRKIL